jgi:HSP20 family protein
MARQFTLGAEIDESAVQARFENGLLTLSLPKKQPPAARRVTIQ